MHECEASGANGPPPTDIIDDLALVSSGHQSCLLLLAGGRLVGRVPTGLAGVQRHAWSPDGSLAVLLGRRRPGWGEVRILVWNGTRLHTCARLATPVPATDLAWLGKQLVIGGHSETAARAWITRPDATDPSWSPLAMPDGELWERKGFDALLVKGTRLIAVDNIVVPKWMVHYQATATGVPQLVAASPLHHNGSYEHIVSAASGDTRFAVLSTTISRLGPRAHITLYSWNDASAQATHTLPPGNWQYAMDGDELWLLRDGIKSCGEAQGHRGRRGQTGLLVRQPGDNMPRPKPAAACPRLGSLQRSHFQAGPMRSALQRHLPCTS